MWGEWYDKDMIWYDMIWYNKVSMVNSYILHTNPRGQFKWPYAVTRLTVRPNVWSVFCKFRKYGHTWHRMFLLRPGAPQNMNINGAHVKLMVRAVRHFLNRVDTLLRTRDMAVLSFAWSLGSPAQPPSLLAIQGRRLPAAVSKPSRVGGRGKWPYLRL